MSLGAEEAFMLAQVRAAMLAQRADDAALSYAERRARWEATVIEAPAPDGVVRSHETVAGVACERNSVDPTGPLVLFLHGGAYTGGSPRTHRALCESIALAVKGEVVAADYALAPEHPYPAGLDQAQAVWAALVAEAGERPLAAAGDSAGGGLLAALVARIGRSGGALPRAVWYLSPWVDLTGSMPSVASRAETDFVLDAPDLYARAALYAAGQPLDHPELSPLNGDLAGHPRTLVQIGGDELFVDEGFAFARKLVEAGVDTTLESIAQLPHGWYGLARFLPTAAAGVRRGCAWLAEALA